MNIDSIIKKEGINVIEQLSTLQVNLVAKNIANKLCKAFPEHGFDPQLLFTNIARMNMYIAEMPNGLVRAKYVAENSSIYFNSDVSLDIIDDLVIHECLHFLQEIKDDSGKLVKLGLANFSGRVYGIALNEAAVQLMAAEANENENDTVTYFNIELPTNTPSYYTLECTLLAQMAFFTGTYPLYESTLTGSSLFENTFIAKSSKHTFNTITNNLDKLVALEDLVGALSNDLQYATDDNPKKISQINKAIADKKQAIFNLFFKTQNMIMMSCFNYEFKYVRNIEELYAFKERLINYQNFIGKNINYKFYDDFYDYTMVKFEEKRAYFEKHDYVIPFGKVNETAIALFETKPNLFELIKIFLNKFRKLNGIRQEKIDKKAKNS